MIFSLKILTNKDITGRERLIYYQRTTGSEQTIRHRARERRASKFDAVTSIGAGRARLGVAHARRPADSSNNSTKPLTERHWPT